MNDTYMARQKGFTLFELLIVVVLITLGTLFIVPQLNLGDSQQRVQKEAERMAVILEAVRQEAILKFKTYVLQVFPTHYQFLVLGEMSGLQPLEDQLFRPRRLPSDMYFKTSLDVNESISLDQILNQGEQEEDSDEEQTDPEQQEPILNIIIFASGELSPFTLEFISESGGEYEVLGEMTGKIKVVNPRAS